MSQRRLMGWIAARSSRKIAIACLTTVATVALGFAEDEPTPKSKDDVRSEIPIEVDDVSIWVGSPSQPTLNAAKSYRNAMPGVVGTSRPRREEKEAAAMFPIAPVSFVQFFGEPTRDLDFDLRIAKGSFLAHWPTAKEHAGRLRWFGSDLTAEPPAGLPQSYLPEDGNLLSKLRGTSTALYLKNESRFERFVAYDADVALPVPVRLRGGPDEYTLNNTTSRRLTDVAVIAPAGDGFRIGWLDELPSAAVEKEKTEKANEKKETAKKDEKADPSKKVDDFFREADEPSEKKEKSDEPPPLPVEGDAEVRARVDQRLNQRITVTAEEASRRELLGMVSSQARLRFEYDDKTLTREKVDLDKPTTIKASEVPARDALADLLGVVNLSYRVTEEGRLFITTAARLAEAAEKKGAAVDGPPVKLGMSQPLKAIDPSYQEFTRDSLTRRLKARGLRDEVIATVLERASKDLFQPGELVVLVGLSREAIDEAVPLDVFPPPKKIARVALVVVHGIDPRLQDRAKALVRELGSPSWKARESAESRLEALGSAAVPALEESLRDKDVEIVYRVERLLLKLNRNVP